MMAMSKKMLEQEPSEIETLLPWHAAGTLNARDARRVDEALARDPELAKQYAVIREEYAETIHLNENLGAPSARAMAKLFAAIDGEPARNPSVWFNFSAGIAEFFAKLSPRTLAWSASLGALAACVVILAIGVAIHKPLAKVPENTLKFGVGTMLSAFGVFWTGEGLGIAWPGQDIALAVFAVLFLAVGIATASVLRRPGMEVLQ